LSNPATGTFSSAAPRAAAGRWRAIASWLQPLVSSGERERRDLSVLLLVVAVVVVPHFDHLPWWSTAVVCGLWTWRAWLTWTRRPLPGRFAMVPLLAAASVSVWLQHGTLFGRDPGVNLLLLLVGLKLLEMRARRDVLIVIFLSFFVLMTRFLYDQGLLLGLLTIATVLALFVVLVSVNMVEGDVSAGAKLRLVLLMFFKALPLTIALFVLFPRLPAPLWGLLHGEASGTTGLSNSMSPGSINRLLQSDAIALRARFEGAIPPNNELYWRGPVFGAFDGRTWTRLATPASDPRELEITVDPASAIDYTVTLEAHEHDWLLALEMPGRVDDAPVLDSRLTPELELRSASPLQERVRYRVRSYTSFSFGSHVPAAALQPYLELPAGFNPRTQRFAAGMKEQVLGPAAAGSHARDADLVAAALDLLHRDDYRYSLQPPPLGRNSVDDLLFETRSGYCEHYASAFVVLMRALEIPARVVTGYQGGAVNPVDGFLTVRQSDAHAWAEVWLETRGWVRVDPTAAIAPERIEHGVDALPGSDLAALARRQGPLGWMRNWRPNWEAIENAWNQWVLSYSSERQRSLMSWLGMTPSWQNLAIMFGSTVSLLLLTLAVFSMRHRVERDPLADLVGRLRQKLEGAGIEIPPSAGPREIARRIDRRLEPGSLQEARSLLGALERARYAPPPARRGLPVLRELRGRVRRFRARPSAA
jgi:transglutaminase-like putative cysteine protease